MLRQGLKKRVGQHAMVVWYDAVTVEGKLQWQNTLGPLNAPFFRDCDALFVNYTWGRGTPGEVLSYLAEQMPGRRPSEVFLGVDVYGRGTYGGGGDSTHTAVAHAMSHGLSSAVFGPGWVYESTGDTRSSWQQRNDQFWERIARVLPHGPRPVAARLPLSTFFSQARVPIGDRIPDAGQPCLWGDGWIFRAR